MEYYAMNIFGKVCSTLCFFRIIVCLIFIFVFYVVIFLYSFLFITIFIDTLSNTICSSCLIRTLISEILYNVYVKSDTIDSIGYLSYTQNLTSSMFGRDYFLKFENTITSMIPYDQNKLHNDVVWVKFNSRKTIVCVKSFKYVGLKFRNLTT